MTAKHLETGQTYSTALSKGSLHLQVCALEKFLFLAWLLARQNLLQDYPTLLRSPGKPLPCINAHKQAAVQGWFTLVVSAGFTRQLPQPWGIFRACLWSNLSQRCVCTNPPSKAQASCSAKLALLSARKGQELEPVRETHQIPSLCREQHSRLVSQSHPHVLCPLSVPCPVLRKSAVLNWANWLLFVFCMFSLGEGGQADVGVIQHNTEITASK